ncbi:MAG: hypothetical protein Kow0069_13140 [Promethearchaeota archaeon]
MPARKVIITAQAFTNAIKYLAQFANFNMPRAQWVEAMGFLFCKVHMNNYVVVDAVGMTSGNEVYVEISGSALGEVERLERERPGTFLGGWFHSHPGLSLFFSDTDVRNQMFYQQQNPDGLGIVFDLTTVSSEFIGFKVFRLHSANAMTYHEVEYELRGFTEETLVEAFDPVGIPRKTIHELAKHLGFGNPDGYVELADVDVPDVEDPLLAGKEHLEKAARARADGRLEAALRACRVADRLLERTGDSGARADCLLLLVELCAQTRNFQTARETAARLRDVVQNEGSGANRRLARADLILGKMALLLDDPADAREGLERLEESRKKFAKLGDVAGEAEALDYLGSVHWKLGRLNDAKRAWSEALQLVEKVEQEPDANATGGTIWPLKRFGLERRVALADQSLEESGISKVRG